MFARKKLTNELYRASIEKCCVKERKFLAKWACVERYYSCVIDLKLLSSMDSSSPISRLLISNN